MHEINDTLVCVYALPERAGLSRGFCFGGGVPIPFLNVDWFNGFDGMTEADVRRYVLKKGYAKTHRELLVLSPENNLAMLIRTETF